MQNQLSFYTQMKIALEHLPSFMLNFDTGVHTIEEIKEKIRDGEAVGTMSSCISDELLSKRFVIKIILTNSKRY